MIGEIASAVVLGNKIVGGIKQIHDKSKKVFDKVSKAKQKSFTPVKTPSTPKPVKSPTPEASPEKVDAMLNNVMKGKLPGGAVKPVGGPVTNPSLKVNSNQVKKFIKKNVANTVKSPVLSAKGKLAKLGFEP